MPNIECPEFKLVPGRAGAARFLLTAMLFFVTLASGFQCSAIGTSLSDVVSRLMRYIHKVAFGVAKLMFALAA